MHLLTGNPEARVERILWPLLFAALLLWSVALQHGGYLHYEGQFFLVNYLDDRSLVDKLFDVRRNDWNCYMGRELVYAFDWLDSQAVVAGARWGVPHLYSTTTYIALFIIAVVGWRVLARFARPIGSTASALLVALFLTSPVASLSGFFYRTSKVLTGLLLLLCVRDVLLALETPVEPTATRQARPHPARLFFLATALTLVDRVGFYLALSIAIIVAVRGVVLRDRRHWALAGALVLSVAFSIAYDVYLGRLLIHYFTGEWPSLFGQRVRVLDLFSERWHYTSTIRVVAVQLDYIFGNWHPAIGVVVGALMAAGYWVYPRRRFTSLGAGPSADEQPGRGPAAGPVALLRAHLPFVLFAVGVALTGVFCMLMIYKLNSILSPESRRVYYWIPLDVIILLASGFALAGLFTRMPALRTPAQVVMGVMVCTNLAALPSHQAVIRNGEQRPQIAEAARIRQCFVGGDAPGAYGLSAAGAYACARVRTRASGRPLDSGVKPGTPLPALYCRNERRVAGT